MNDDQEKPVLSLAETIRKKITESKAQPNAGERIIANVEQSSGARIISRRCPACEREFFGTPVVCQHDGTLLIPISLPVEHRWTDEFPLGKICDQCLGCFDTDVCPTDNSTLRQLAWTDTPIIAQKWKLVRLIGDGRLTRVFEARSSSGERAVVKILHPHLSLDRKTAKRFITAIKDSVGLVHTNIAKVFDGDLIGAQPYVAMEMIDGDSMQAYVESYGKAPADEVVQMFVGVCKGLAYAHAAGVLHCNLTLSNIYLTKNGSAKIVDFGAAERLFRHLEWDQQMTHTANLYGNWFCLSPEYCKKSIVSERSDIYSMGCVMYETLSGKPVFDRPNSVTTLFAHMSEPAPPFDPALGIPDWLGRIVLRCLDKDPDQRFQSANDLCAELMLGKQ